MAGALTQPEARLTGSERSGSGGASLASEAALRMSVSRTSPKGSQAARGHRLGRGTPPSA